MLCRYCGSETRVLSTRTPQGEFYVVRRLACVAHPEKHRFNTVEVLESFMRKIGSKRRGELLGYNRRGADRMRVAHERKSQIIERARRGDKYDVIAIELGVSHAMVRKYVSQAIQAGDSSLRRGGHGKRSDLQSGRAHVQHGDHARNGVLERQALGAHVE